MCSTKLGSHDVNFSRILSKDIGQSLTIKEGTPKMQVFNEEIKLLTQGDIFLEEPCDEGKERHAMH